MFILTALIPRFFSLSLCVFPCSCVGCAERAPLSQCLTRVFLCGCQDRWGQERNKAVQRTARFNYTPRPQRKLRPSAFTGTVACTQLFEWRYFSWTLFCSYSAFYGQFFGCILIKLNDRVFELLLIDYNTWWRDNSSKKINSVIICTLMSFQIQKNIYHRYTKILSSKTLCFQH